MISVMIATFNRADILRSVLQAYCCLNAPHGGWELILIDNSCTDHTDTVIQGFRSRLPMVALRETRQGKNHALNHGLRSVRGDLVVFTDDDVFPREDWLLQYERLSCLHLDYDLFGGVTLPRWETPPPEWILSWVPLGPTFTVSPTSLKEGPSVPANTFGTNYAVRSEIFQAGRRFDVEIGPRGASYAMGSETQLIQALFREGHTIWHSNAPVVEHWVEANKLNRTWILGRAQRYGRGQFRLGMEGEPRPRNSWFGVPRYLLRQACCEYAQYVSEKLRGHAREAFEAEWKFNTTVGAMKEARIMQHSSKQGDQKRSTGAGTLSGTTS